MSEAFKWGGSAPEAARAATAGLNQEADRAEGGHTLGCEGGVNGSAGPALCMYDRDRLKEKEEMTEFVSVLVWKHMCVFSSFVIWLECLKCFFLVSLHPSLNLFWKDSRRHPGPFAVWHAPSPCQDSLSLPLSVSLSSLSPTSRWLTQALRRQVRSTTLILCKKHKQPSPLTLPSFSFPSFTLTATLLCLSLDGFV